MPGTRSDHRQPSRTPRPRQVCAGAMSSFRHRDTLPAHQAVSGGTTRSAAASPACAPWPAPTPTPPTWPPSSASSCSKAPTSPGCGNATMSRHAPPRRRRPFTTPTSARSPSAFRACSSRASPASASASTPPNPAPRLRRHDPAGHDRPPPYRKARRTTTAALILRRPADPDGQVTTPRPSDPPVYPADGTNRRPLLPRAQLRFYFRTRGRGAIAFATRYEV